MCYFFSGDNDFWPGHLSYPLRISILVLFVCLRTTYKEKGILFALESLQTYFVWKSPVI